MGIMATQTRSLIDRVIPMGLFKRRLIVVMAAKAEGCLRLFKQPLLVRAMGKMASLAPILLQNSMADFLFIILFPMALVTGFIPFGLQKTARL
jgi:hypothetical protein